MPSRTQKNPLEQALGQFATPETKDECLRICHAALSTAMVNSLLGAGTTEKKGALAEAYAETIKLVESMMGGATSAYAPPQKTIFVAGKANIPRNASPH